MVIVSEVGAWWRVRRAGVPVRRATLPLAALAEEIERQEREDDARGFEAEPIAASAVLPVGGDELRVRAGLRRAGVVL
ncbi:hypothetical protein [Streptomyces fradiae]|uniref:hypothetical protein n=1 Tax=Streptomyces fradiae TaxID=1906 RepID=UPI0033FBC453